MKIKNNLLHFFLGSIILLGACSKDESPSPVKNQIESNIQKGTWQITKFIDSGVDETSHFTGYSFTFLSSGVLSASNGSNTYEGTWSITDSNSNDDSQDDLDFNINYNLANDFDDLTEDWEFITQSATKIELIHTSGGGGGTDYLTFEKK